MKLLPNPVHQDGPVSLILGNFDGVHIGHQAIIKQALDLSKQKGLRTCLLSFQPHPLKVLAPARAPKLLQTEDQKQRLLEHYGLDAYWPCRFDQTIATMSPEAFVAYLCQHLQLRVLLVGFNFRFGHRREGDILQLKQLGQDYRFECKITEAVTFESTAVSSSSIRRLVARGELVQAGKLLGRPYFLEGVVKKGRQLGRSLDAPTANIQVSNEMLPKFGVYATWVRLLDGTWHRGITNIGEAPTVANKGIRVETHLFDFSGDLYGQHIQVYFGTSLRPELRFSGLEALKAQIQEDFHQRLDLEDVKPPVFYLKPKVAV